MSNKQIFVNNKSKGVDEIGEKSDIEPEQICIMYFVLCILYKRHKILDT